MIDEIEKEQIRSIRRVMESDGWQALMMAFCQIRESGILEKLKASRAEAHWRYHQGRLDGFDLAVGLAEKLVAKLGPDDDEQTPEQITKEIDEVLKGRKT